MIGRWTQNEQEAQYLAKISREIPPSGVVEFRLHSGQIVEGVIRKENAGNNAGQGGWRYHGGCEIETLDRRRIAVDYLDVASARDVSHERNADYEKAGIVRFGQLPGQSSH